MKYITVKRARFNGICGYVNIPYGTEVEVIDDIIMANGYPVCFVSSQHAYDYFARNDDGNGLERGQLIQSIMKRLAKQGENHQARWGKIWGDEVCKKYKRSEADDYWLWNHEFYQADICVLEYIANLIGIKVEGELNVSNYQN